MNDSKASEISITLKDLFSRHHVHDEMTNSLLQTQHDDIVTLDDFGDAPLVVAASSAAGRSNKSSIETHKNHSNIACRRCQARSM